MVRLWDVETGKEIHRLAGHTGGLVATVAFSPNGRYLVSRGGIDGAVILWNATTGKESRRYQAAKGNPWRFSRDMPLAFPSRQPDARLRRPQGGAFLGRGHGHGSPQPDGASDRLPEHRLFATSASMATGGIDGNDKHSVRIWDLKSGRQVQQCRLPKDEPPISLAFLADGAHLAAAIEEDVCHVFAVADGKPVYHLPYYWATRIVCSPDGKTLLTAPGNMLRHWDAATGRPQRAEFRGAPGRSLVGGRLAGREIRRLGGGGRPPVGPGYRCAAAADRRTGRRGRVLARQQDARHGRRRQDRSPLGAATGRDAGALRGHRFDLLAVAFSPDGALLASADRQGAVRIWDVAKQKEQRSIETHSAAEQLSLAFSADSKSLACGAHGTTPVFRRAWTA